jgi:hypothetical protein
MTELNHVKKHCMNPLSILRFSGLVLIVSLLVACGDPKNAVIPPDMNAWKTDAKFQEAVQKLQPDDKAVLAQFMIRKSMAAAFGGDGIQANTTIGQAIEDQKVWAVQAKAKEEAEAAKAKQEAERQKALAEEVKKKEQAARDAMNSVLTASIISLKYHPSGMVNHEYIRAGFDVNIAFKNISQGKLVGIKGGFIVRDIFDVEMKKFVISDDSGIDVGQTITWNGTVDYNQFTNDDQKLRNTDFDKMKFEWVPLVYLFQDGKKLELDQK